MNLGRMERENLGLRSRTAVSSADAWCAYHEVAPSRYEILAEIM